MKTKLIAAITAIATLFCLTACQATPEQNIVVKKDTERMVEQAISGETDATLSTIGIPAGNYTHSLTSADNKLRVNVDANISVPDVDAMPIIKTSMDLFTQEQITGFFNYLFPNEKPKTDAGQVETKDTLEKEILQMKKQLAEGIYEGYTKEEFEAKIASCEEAYRNAANDMPKNNTSDGTLTPGKANPDSSERKLKVSDEKFSFIVNTHTTLTGIGMNSTPALLYLCKDNSRMYSLRNMLSADEAALPDAIKEKLAITYNEAQKLCEDFFTAGGMENEFCVGAAYIVDNEADGTESVSKNYAYKLYYTRITNKIPLFFEASKSFVKEDEMYNVPWGYESIEFIVDDDGIAYISWANPIKIGDIVSKNVTLKPFNEIETIFDGMIKTTYEGVIKTIFDGKMELDINVSDIRLCLLRIREQNAAQTDGLLVPAWIFYGQNKGTDQNGKLSYFKGAGAITNTEPVSSLDGELLEPIVTVIGTESKNESVALLAINAIDGSVIDLSKGY